MKDMKCDPEGREGAADLSDELIILCPSPSSGSAKAGACSPLEVGFEKLCSVASAGRSAKLIAHGCTLPTSQPDWLKSDVNVSVSELGDFRLGNPIEQTRALSNSVRSWLDSTFAPAAGRQPANRIFYGSLAGRVLQPLFEAIPYAHGLAAAYPNGTFFITDKNWQGAEVLRSLIEPTGGRVISEPVQRIKGWRIRFTVVYLLSLLRALVGQIRNYVISRKEQVFLGRHSLGVKTKPKIWLGVISNWDRINRHLIDRIALPLLDRKIPFGIALIATLGTGEEGSGKKGTVTSYSPWPILDFLGQQIDNIPVVQLVRPQSLICFLSALRKGCVASLRIGWRLLRQGPCLEFIPYQVRVDNLCGPISALATIDVLPVAMAIEALSGVSDRHNFIDAKVVFSSVGVADSAAADHALRQSGATTINFVHGALGDGWYGQTENCSDYMMVWTHTDVTNCLLQSTSAIFNPPDEKLEGRTERRPVRNIVFITNYLHQDTAAAGYPLKPFLIEILRSEKLIEQAHPGAFRFRWRPHPSDVRSEIDCMAAGFPTIDLSRRLKLAEDLNWADIAVISPSTTILDALSLGLPVFVHCPPAQRCLPEMQAYSDERKFFYANDLSLSLTRLVKAIDDDIDNALAPERELYRSLVGLGEAPDDICDLLSKPF